MFIYFKIKFISEIIQCNNSQWNTKVCFSVNVPLLGKRKYYWWMCETTAAAVVISRLGFDSLSPAQIYSAINYKGLLKLLFQSTCYNLEGENAID